MLHLVGGTAGSPRARSRWWHRQARPQHRAVELVGLLCFEVTGPRQLCLEACILCQPAQPLACRRHMLGSRVAHLLHCQVAFTGCKHLVAFHGRRRLPRATRQAPPACCIRVLPCCTHALPCCNHSPAAGDHHSRSDGHPLPVAFTPFHVAFTQCKLPRCVLWPQEITTRDETGAPCARGMRTTPFGQYVADGPPTCLSGEHQMQGSICGCTLLW